MSEFWRISAEGRVHPPSGDAAWTAGFLAAKDQWTKACPMALTSGSTGQPVEHRFSTEAVLASAEATAQHFGLDHPDVETVAAWSALPAAGTGGRMMVWRALALGWDLTVSRPAAAPAVPPVAVPHGRYHFAVATPLQAKHLMDSGQLHRFSILLLGGAPVSPVLEAALEQAALQARCRIYHGFGMTETLTHVATRSLGTEAYTALPGVEIGTAASGALTLDIPRRGVQQLVTKDAVEILPEPSSGDVDGRQFRWLGRLDDVINSGGLKFHPATLERRWSSPLKATLGNRRWFVTGRPDHSLGARVTLVVEGPNNSTLEAAVLDALADEGNARPRSVEFQQHFTETASGKVRRN
ncbi:AMP-binding protein [Flavobacteriales bacterium]|nr:AMP-binding protein [Flavobacteriales bacterium]